MIYKLIAAIRARYEKHEYVWIVSAVLAWQFFLIAVSNGLMPETDNYTHAMRLADFIRSKSWAEILYRHDNNPFGQILHFTRINDLALLLPTLPFLPFTDLKDAILRGCFLYQPVMAALSAAALIWTGRVFLPVSIRLLSVLLYFCPPAIYSLFVAGRADHHVFLNLAWIAVLGCLFRGVKTQRIRWFKRAGILAGVSVWISPEGFLMQLAATAGLVAGWLFRIQNMRQIFLFAFWSFLSAAVCLVLNPPMQGLFFADNGRLSVLLVAVFGLAAAAFALERLLEKRKIVATFFGRFFSLAFLTFWAFGIELFLFDEKVFASPIPPELFEVWAIHISELQPTIVSAKYMLMINFPSIVATAAGVLFFARADVRRKKALLTAGLPCLFFFLAALFSYRFGRIAVPFAATGFGVALSAAGGGSVLRKKPVAIAARVLDFCAVAVALYMILYGSYLTETGLEKEIMRPADYVPYLSPKKGGVLTSSSRGPETAWGSDRPVVGSPYHSNAQGIQDAYETLYATDMNRVGELLRLHEITTVLLDAPYYEAPEKARQIARESFKNKPEFSSRLIVGRDLPCFVVKAPGTPKEVDDRYIIYHVDFNRCFAPLRSALPPR